MVRAALADAFLAYASAVDQNRQRAGHEADSEHSPYLCHSTPPLPCSPCPHAGHHQELDSHAGRGSPDRGGVPQALGRGRRLKDDEPCSRGSQGSDCARWCLHGSPGAGSGRGDGVAVCDNYNSKVSGWRSAVRCVGSLMRMDDVVTTGVDRQTQPAHTVLL